MNTDPGYATIKWPAWKKIAFRFFFIYLIFQIAPWSWFSDLPGLSSLLDYYYTFTDWMVNTANAHFFHIKDTLVPVNGSGDTSYAWAQLPLYLCLSALVCFIWSLLDRRRLNYQYADYWLCTLLRYYIALISFTYGINKLFALQMPYPNQSMLATPLGDLLPMRLSWLFFGYSAHYQIFSGILEVMAGILLLYRRTVTLGLFIATGVYLNVMMLNLSYDIPVKLFSISMVFYCMFLLAHDYKRIFAFFLLNKAAPGNTVYDIRFTKKWMRITRCIVKTAFIILAAGVPFYFCFSAFNKYSKLAKPSAFNGIYTISNFTLNNQSAPVADSLCWKDIIFDDAGQGSINCRDSSFRVRYGRSYFAYLADTTQHTILLKNIQNKNEIICTLHYEKDSSGRMKLNTRLGSNSLNMELSKCARHFQLTEKPVSLAVGVQQVSRLLSIKN